MNGWKDGWKARLSIYNKRRIHLEREQWIESERTPNYFLSFFFLILNIVTSHPKTYVVQQHLLRTNDNNHSVSTSYSDVHVEQVRRQNTFFVSFLFLNRIIINNNILWEVMYNAIVFQPKRWKKEINPKWQSGLSNSRCTCNALCVFTCAWLCICVCVRLQTDGQQAKQEKKQE